MTKSDANQDTLKYRLKFLPEAMEVWNALDGSVKQVLRKALKKRLEHRIDRRSVLRREGVEPGHSL